MSTETRSTSRTSKNPRMSVQSFENSKLGTKKDTRNFDDGRFSKRRNVEKPTGKSDKGEGSASFDRRKKRIHASRNESEDGDLSIYEKAKMAKRKNSFRTERNQFKVDLSGRTVCNKSARSMWVTNEWKVPTSDTKKHSPIKKDARERVNKLFDGTRKMEGKKFIETDVIETGSLKKDTTRNSYSDKRVGFNERKELGNEKNRDKKILHGDDMVEAVGHPMKSKRVIRILPNDLSNKRLDDGIIVNEIKVKEKMSETNDEMSKNAQFRAIRPSPSILSYVEDNLLGRRRLIELKRAGYNVDLSAPLDNIPNSTNPERERIEENIFRSKMEFFAAAKLSSSFPPPNLPEIAFAGRSNVGKSSLLNALTRQWGVARTSDKPGLTQTINFFKLDPKLCLVDLPGYGFAYAKEEVKDAWEELVKEYVSERVGLRRVCLLIDTKWGMKPRDRELIDLMERSQTKYQVVLTKTDAVFPIDVARRGMQIEESLKSNKCVVQPVMMVSSKSGAGIRGLRATLAKIARFAKL